MKESYKDMLVDTSQKLLVDQTNISNYIFDSLSKAINSMNIENTPYNTQDYGLDGYILLLEIHNEKGYIFIRRWAPKEESFKVVSELFHTLSGVKYWYF